MSRNNRNRNRNNTTNTDTGDKGKGMTRVTVQGIDVTVTAGRLDDWEFMEALYELQDGDALQAVPILRSLLGEDTYRQVKDRLRDPHTGRVSGGRMAEWITELFRRLSPNS